MANKFWFSAPIICGSSVWNILYVTFLGPGILILLLNSWKMYVPYSTQYKSYMCLYGCAATDKVR